MCLITNALGNDIHSLNFWDLLYIAHVAYTYTMMKLCRYCGNSYPETDFGVAKTTDLKIYRRQKCRFCYRKTKNALKAKRRELIETTKELQGCMRCGITDPRVLEFHHLDTSKKEFSIADYYY